MKSTLLPIFALSLAGCPAQHGGGGEADAAVAPGADAAPGGGLARCASGEESLEEIWRVSNLHGAILAGSLAPDTGVLVVTSEDGSVKQWSLGTAGAPTPAGQPVYGTPFAPRDVVVGAVAFAADGGFVAGGDEEGHALLWAAEDTSLVADLPIGAEPIAAVAITADGAFVTVADTSFGGNVRQWDVADTSVSDPLPTTLWGVTAAAYARDRDLLVLAGDDYGQPSVDLRRSSAPTTVDGSWLDLVHVGGVSAIAVSDERIYAAGGGFVAVVPIDDPESGLAADAVFHTAVAVAVAPGGELFVTAGTEGTVRLWDTATRAELASAPIPAPAAMALDAAGERIVVATADGHVLALSCR
jgi:WD40 repeat protein